MTERKQKIQTINQKILAMRLRVMEGTADFNSAKLVGVYVAKGGLNPQKEELKNLTPKLIKVLFDFAEIELCVQVMENILTVFPDDPVYQAKLNKLKELEKHQKLKKVLPKKVASDTDPNDLSDYDLANEISRIEEKANQSSKIDNDESVVEISNQQTLVSDNTTAFDLPDMNERTLVPLTPTPDYANVSAHATSFGQPIAPSKISLPSQVIFQYPGLTMLSGRYEYIDILGEGGMGGVFLAQDKQLERKVAIKFMNQACIANPEVSERFIREARAQAVASHPGIVHIFDVGTEANPFIVMEFVEGQTIKECLKKDGGFSIKKSIELMSTIAEALEYAHFKKITHRDVKPDNILIDHFGKTRLLDFGLAKLDHAPSMTIGNQIMGTPYYMAPEQIRGEDVGPATDIYAWGIMFYLLCTGIVPFTKGDILYHHVNSTPIEPKKLAMDIPNKLNQIILKSIAKPLSDRYQEFKTIINELKTIKI